MPLPSHPALVVPEPVIRGPRPDRNKLDLEPNGSGRSITESALQRTRKAFHLDWHQLAQVSPLGLRPYLASEMGTAAYRRSSQVGLATGFPVPIEQTWPTQHTTRGLDLVTQQPIIQVKSLASASLPPA